ncbi:MAG: hypothetical protein IPJ85_13560 [Flavobacteriales bacterium]|nr:hypothetical protein [Flavobacteriales bacterium]
MFIPLVSHPFGLPDEPPGWAFAADDIDGALVYRTLEYGRPIIGALEIVANTREVN